MVIPKLTHEKYFNHTTPGPGWMPVSQANGPHKPLIKCKCGQVMGVRRHSLSASGELRASFFHPQADGGCGFHEFLELEGYDGPAVAAGAD